MEILPLVARAREILVDDLNKFGGEIGEIIQQSSFLVIGGAGSIGQAVVREIFLRKPKRLYVVDISENNLVELVRDLRSSIGYISGDFQVFALDVGSTHFFEFLRSCDPFDFVLNLSAMKHVRSEKDAYTLMRLLDVNLFNVASSIDVLRQKGCKKYFAVSTDKATNPANLMGASKYLMEQYLFSQSDQIPISSARFANVAFSDGSLLHGFEKRIQKRQPLSAPSDIRRYFITPSEAGKICLFSCILGENRDIYFPKLSKELNEITFAEIAVKFLASIGKEAVVCKTENEARDFMLSADDPKYWPCYFFSSDTTGEKDFEEFYTSDEVVDLDTYADLGVIKNAKIIDNRELVNFMDEVADMKTAKIYNRSILVSLFSKTVKQLNHKEMGKFLDEKM